MLRFARAFGCDAHLVVTYEVLLLTMASGAQFRTKVGSRVPGMNVNLAAVAAVKTLVDAVEAGHVKDLADIRGELERIEHEPPIYNRWVVVAGLSLTAASLSRLFGGDWPTFFVALVAGAVGTWLRQEMGRRGWNLFLTAFAGAAVSGILAASPCS